MSGVILSGVPIGGRSTKHPAEWVGTNQEPWIARGAIPYIYRHLRALQRPRILEYGAGSSTPWFINACGGRVVSIEHHRGWMLKLDNKLSQHPKLMRRWSGRLVPNESTGKHRGSDGKYYDKYVNYVRELGFRYDAILIDGRARAACIRAALPYLRHGGLFIVDNSERPRYAEAIGEIPKNWPRIDFSSPVGRTSVWVRPRRVISKRRLLRVQHV